MIPGAPSVKNYSTGQRRSDDHDKAKALAEEEARLSEAVARIREERHRLDTTKASGENAGLSLQLHPFLVDLAAQLQYAEGSLVRLADRMVMDPSGKMVPPDSDLKNMSITNLVLFCDEKARNINSSLDFIFGALG